MNEASVCRMFSKAVAEQGGMSWKISDPNGNFMQATKRPFDGFGSIRVDEFLYPLYWEAKCLKKLEAFNTVNSLRSHQAESLDSCLSIQNAFVWVPLGVDVSRKDKRLYVFDWKSLRNFYYSKNTKNSISAKKLDSLPYMEIKKESFVLDINKVIVDF